MSKVKKILHLHNTSSIGGAEQMFINLADFINPDKFKSYVGVFREGELTSELRKRNIKILWFKESTQTYDYKFLKNIIQLIKLNRIDLIHSHTWGTDFYGYWATKILKIPMISTIHNRYYIFEKWSRRFSYKIFISQVKKIVVVSKDIQNLLREELKLSPQKVKLIYNGIDTHKFENKKDFKPLRKELNLSEEELILGNVGNLREVKDHHTLILSFHRIASIFPRAKLLIVGEGELKSSLVKLCSELGLESRVLFLGHRDDVPQILKLMDIFILSSHSEGCSISVLEAMASGKPVIATRVGGNPELVLEGKTGFLVPPAEPEKLAEKILSLLKNEDLRLKMGDEGRRKVKEKFSLETMIKNYEELYSKVLR
ncbi:MAG: glycosyltransferase family 4 protein [candidate division Zixibacteria bacterium]|nr:glycosyltransferase family 4 protein [candidate division Zixibacteria bacterium]